MGKPSMGVLFDLQMEIGQIELGKQVEIESKPVWAHVSTQQT